MDGKSDDVQKPGSGEENPQDQEFRFALKAPLSVYESILIEDLELGRAAG
ncbi:MAG: hypothetical protein ACYDCG_20430 [Candidatus Acidiferrales bacterium]